MVDDVSDDCVYLSGLDILDGTPVLDIKPYIPDYDAPSTGLHNIGQETVRDSLQQKCLEESRGENLTEFVIKPNSSCNVTVACDQQTGELTVLQNSWDHRLAFSRGDISEKESDSKSVDDAFHVPHCQTCLMESTVDVGDTCISPLDDFKANSQTNNRGTSDKSTVSDTANGKSEELSLTSHLSTEKKSNNQAELQPPHASCDQLESQGNLKNTRYKMGVTTASWLKAAPSSSLRVVFNPIAEAQVKLFSQNADKEWYRYVLIIVFAGYSTLVS